MLCVSVAGPTIGQAKAQIETANTYRCAVELRVDLLEERSLETISRLQTIVAGPLVLTFRTQAQGGGGRVSAAEYALFLRQLIRLNPQYLDVEYHLPEAEVMNLAKLSPNTKILVSYHNFENMTVPENIFPKMENVLYKAACMTCRSSDSLSLMSLMAQQSDRIHIGMGEHGAAARIAAKKFNHPLSFCTAGKEGVIAAPGQVAVKDLFQTYRWEAIGSNTALYGLIGDPITRSISHKSHNLAFDHLQQDAVYVKMRVPAAELEEFCCKLRNAYFCGLSVTMPLKEQIIPFLQAVDPDAARIGAVNTLRIEQGRITGYNTDGTGALNAIEEHVPIFGKKIGMIGAGGAAKAIAYEAVRRGAQVTVFNRTPERAAQLAQNLNCQACDLGEISQKGPFDLLINCTPVDPQIPMQDLAHAQYAMDISTLPVLTPFLAQAQQAGCKLIYGYEMFTHQAAGQFNLWFGNNPSHLRALKAAVLKALKTFVFPFIYSSSP